MASKHRGRSPWTLFIYVAWTEVIDAFAGYDNTLAFGIGQETINENATSTLVAPSLKAAARSLHAFSTARGYRSIPLAYSASDVPSVRLLTAQYLTCSSSSSSSNNNNSSSSDDTTKDPATIDLLGFIIFLTESCTSDTAWIFLLEDQQPQIHGFSQDKRYSIVSVN
ncbi:hypothetical protein VTI28DRAFT_4450 [Corynascus sepedonium]